MIQVAPGPFKLFILVELELQGKMFSCSRSFERGQRTRQEQLHQLRTSLETFILCQSLVGATVSQSSSKTYFGIFCENSKFKSIPSFRETVSECFDV